MSRLLTILLLLFLLTGCSGNKDFTTDIILVNAKGRIVIDGNSYSTDSLRIQIDELIGISVYAKGFDSYDATIFPNSSITKKNGVNKIYITLIPSNREKLHRKYNQRWMELINSDLTMYTDDFEAYDNLEQFYDNVELSNRNFEKSLVADRINRHKYRYVKNSLFDFGLADILDGTYTMSDFNFPEIFKSAEDHVFLSLEVKSIRIVAIENDHAGFQISADWVLLNDYDEVLYRHRFRHYTSMYDFKVDDKHGGYYNGDLFEKEGITVAVSEALETGFYDFLSAKRTQALLNKKHPLFYDTKTSNQQLPAIQLSTSNRKMSESIEDGVNGTVLITNSNGSAFGSGSILSSDGYILTNYHVIAGMDTIKVKLNSGKEKIGKLVRSDRKLDIALIKIQGDNYHPISLSPNGECHLGETVYLIGTPNELDHFNTLVQGNICAKRTINKRPYLQTNNPGWNGMSGGPLINSRGQQIAVQVWGLVDGNGDQIFGFCYAIPITEALESLNIQK